MKRIVRPVHALQTALAAAAVGACALAMFPAVASAAGAAYVVADVQCQAGGAGVLDLTFVNPGSGPVTAVVTQGGVATPVVVAADSASAFTLTGLADGPVVVPVALDGVDATVSATVACEQPQVEVMSGQLPETGSSTGGLLIGSAMVLAGAAASLVSRRRA